MIISDKLFMESDHTLPITLNNVFWRALFKVGVQSRSFYFYLQLQLIIRTFKVLGTRERLGWKMLCSSVHTTYHHLT
jgi:hypothetical protein